MQGLRTRSLIGSGKCQWGLYLIDMFEKGRRAMMTTMDTWHKRLGHASRYRLSNVSFLKNNSSKLSNVFCDSCAKAKHVRNPFPKGFIKTNGCFELIHCDIWGCYRIPSYTRADFFLTIVDDYSRSVCVFLIKHKSNASQCLMNFHKLIKVQFGKHIKRVRCDNGREFTSNSMITFYEKNGILLETTCPHTPQQNGVVERKHKHLLETGRALRFEVNIPKKFQGECILTAAYIINHLPSKVIKNKTPYELVWNEETKYEDLRIFGCLAYFKNTNTKGDKFEEKGKPEVFLGYPQGTKGYKIYDIESKKSFSNHEPSCFEQATQDEKWRNAMQKEIKALEKNGTWTLEELPKGKRPIDSKCVYKTKFKSNREIERYKARLIAKGCTQREGVDYHETFAPVVKLVTVRTLLAVATNKGRIIHQLDVNIEFLHGGLDEEVYMKIPKGFAKEGETRTKKKKKLELMLSNTEDLLYLQASRPDVTYAVNVLGPITLTAYCDSKWLGCPFTRRSKTGDIETKPIESKLQLADLLTKGLDTQQLRSLLNKMGIRDLHASS
uniref:Retrovirus-related Pol polyprotein from transposon TNT 1-94 n=1 Tax=Tanacetum cinerariifolium TaxID=118510 RepID=A0A699J3L9_TANCI|nr:retrovirus-related Pol polyprotein from transposon TNT 1-94 [Tanacetum cinerariifolium]